jgi:aldose 1-epimerase
MTDHSLNLHDIPNAPPGWEGAAETLHRIVSQDGDAVAWFCPELGGNTVAYAVQAGGRWVQVFDIGSPAQLRETPSRYGLPILFPFPGGMRGGSYQWGDQEHKVPPTYPGGSDVVIHGFAHIRPWQFWENSGDRALLVFSTPESLDPDRAASYPFSVRLTHEVSLGPDGLTSTLIAENQGQEAAPLAFGLHPYFGADVLGPDRSLTQVELPGASARSRTNDTPPQMTGDKEPAPDGPVAVVPLGETMIASRTDFPPAPAVARIVNLPPLGGHSGWTLEVSMDEGYRDLLLFAPPTSPSISIEPQSHMPGGASLPEGHPEGLIGLEPGAMMRATATIRLVPPA